MGDDLFRGSWGHPETSCSFPTHYEVSPMPCSLLPELESGLLSSWKTTKPKDGSYPVDTAPRSPCSIGQAVSQPSWQPVCSEHETFGSRPSPIAAEYPLPGISLLTAAGFCFHILSKQRFDLCPPSFPRPC